MNLFIKYRRLREFLSLFFVFVLIISLLPISVTANSEPTNINDYDVKIKWMPEKSEIFLGEDGVINFSASLNTEYQGIENADVKIEIAPETVNYINDFKDENGNLDINKKVLSQEGVEIGLSSSGDKYYLYFSLDTAFNTVSYSFTYNFAEDVENSFNIELTEDDVLVENAVFSNTEGALETVKPEGDLNVSGGIENTPPRQNGTAPSRCRHFQMS